MTPRPHDRYMPTDPTPPPLADHAYAVDSVWVWLHNLGLGDIVNSIPVLRQLRRRYERAHIQLSCGPAYHELLRPMAIADRFTPEFSKPQMNGPCDLAVEVVAHARSSRASETGAKVTLSLAAMGTRSPRQLVWRHLREQAIKAGLAVPDAPPQVSVSATVERDAVNWLCARQICQPSEPVVAVHPGAGFEFKLWPAKRFGELARRLRTYHGAHVLVFQGPADEHTVEGVVAAADGSISAIARDLPLEMVAALIQRATLFISCDSGLMHLAAALGRPMVALFGPTSPQAWGPFHNQARVIFERPLTCPPCGYAMARRCPHRRCMNEITTDMVMEQVRAFLPPVNGVKPSSVPAAAMSRRGSAPPEQPSLPASLSPQDTSCPCPTDPPVDAGPTLRIVFAVCRETDASEMLSLLLHLPRRYAPLVLVSQRHPLMGTILRRHCIAFESYRDTEGFYRFCERHRARVIVWASYANMDRYAPDYHHVFIDHGMASKGHFMRDLKMVGGPGDLNEFSLVCAPNAFTFDGLTDLGYLGRLVLTGYLKGDLYVNGRKNRSSILPALGLDPSRPTAVYVPTNVGWIGTGTFDRFYRVVAQATRQLGYNLIIKVHEEDYVHRPHLLAAVEASLSDHQVIILDWESPVWITLADVVIGDASSANIEAIMAGKPTILLPPGAARSVDNTDADLAGAQLRMQHTAAPVADSADELSVLLRSYQSIRPDQSIVPYFNAFLDGQVHSRVVAAIDKLLEESFPNHSSAERVSERHRGATQTWVARA
jgi:ADP-heptose:LPS heptosyltransferase